MTKTIVVYSGGLDSTVLLTQAKKECDEVVAVNFVYGSKHNQKEREAAQRITSLFNIELKMFNLESIFESFKSDLLKSGGEIPEGHYAADNMKSTVVPFRNGIMLSITAGYAESIEANQIVLASHSGDHFVYPDCRPEFNTTMSSAIWYGTEKNIAFSAPYSPFSKADIVKKGVELNAPLHLTYSCYKGKEKHCGKCGTCVERIEAFQIAGYIDPVDYKINIDWGDCIPLGNYTNKRE